MAYRYGWDSVNRKKRYMGKYSEINPQGQGYYGNNEAGNPQEFTEKNWGTQREFVGSRTQEYTFSDAFHGTHTITAGSYKEALRIAESMGYTRSDYKPRGRRKRGK